MASLERRGDRFRIKFRFGGRQLSIALKTDDLREANGLLGKLDYNLILLERGQLDLPRGADIGQFLISDGRTATKPTLEAQLPLSEFFRLYRERPTVTKESNTQATEKIHMDNLERLIGERVNVRAVNIEMLQKYVERRAAEAGLRGTISHDTIRKEIGTFSAIWNCWGVQHGHVTGAAPTRGLIYPKRKEKLPFQTWEQIEKIIGRGGLTDVEKQELWDSLFLSEPQLRELLRYVRETARQSWIHPMFAFAVHTGARRSELLRCRIDDVDISSARVRIREKKRDTSRDFTFRYVPLAHRLSQILIAWLSAHPGGQLLFCDAAAGTLNVNMASYWFGKTLEGGKWAVLKGWHVLRHSFASNCAARGVDQRLIDSWVGHETEEMSRRYRHLFPSNEHKAIESVFGK